MKAFGDRLREKREERGMTQNQLAKELNTVRQNLSRWELGQFEPSQDEIIEICKLLEVTADYLLGLEDENGIKTYDQRSYGNKGNITYNNK